MNDKTGTVVGLTLGAAAINSFHAFSTEGVKTMPEVVVGNAAVLVTFIGVGQFLNWSVALLLAVLYFMGTMFRNGLPFIEWLTKLVG